MLDQMFNFIFLSWIYCFCPTIIYYDIYKIFSFYGKKLSIPVAYIHYIYIFFKFYRLLLHISLFVLFDIHISSTAIYIQIFIHFCCAFFNLGFHLEFGIFMN